MSKIIGVTVGTPLSVNKIKDKINPIGTRGTGEGAEIFNNASSASGKNSHAEGFKTVASGENSHAEGNGATASGLGSHAEGYLTQASGDWSHVEGYMSKATAIYAHAEGHQCYAEEEGSHAEGAICQATGKFSHAEGYFSRASGERSHAEGSMTQATKLASHAEGADTVADGSYSHAEGRWTVAEGGSQHVQGKFNISDKTSAHIVGNGKSDAERSNAHTLDWDGNAWFAGDVYVGSTSGTNKDEGSVKLQREIKGVAGQVVGFDANGNAVAQDAPSGGGGAPADWLAKEGELGHVLNRTHYKEVKMEPFEVNYWDLIAETNDMYDLSALAGGPFTIYKMTDTPFTREQLDGAELEYQATSYTSYGSVKYMAETSVAMSETVGGVVEFYDFATERKSLAVDGDWGNIIVLPSNLEIPGLGTVKKGTYINSSKITGGILNGDWILQNTVFYPLESSYLPPQPDYLFVGLAETGTGDGYEIKIPGFRSQVDFTVNSRFMQHVRENKPVSFCLSFPEGQCYAWFQVRFPIRQDHHTNDYGYYAEQIIYSCDLGVLLIEFTLSAHILTIKVDNLATKMGCITTADTINVAEEGM